MKPKKKKPGGYIKLWRKMLDSDFWYNGEPFDERSAWIDLLLDANYSDGTVQNNGKDILIKRSEIATSERQLAERWGWDRSRVRKFLAKLREENQISPNLGPEHFTHFSLINYEHYQGSAEQNKPKLNPKNAKQIEEDKEEARATRAASLLGPQINLWDEED